jgi:hypothetical protein
MNPFHAFLLGLFVGANVGLFVFALCAAAARADKNAEEPG